jgi:hypothetical protein
LINSKAGHEVLTAVGVNRTVFWGVTPCSAAEVNRHLGKSTASIPRMQEYAKGGNSEKARFAPFTACFLLGLLFGP